MLDINNVEVNLMFASAMIGITLMCMGILNKDTLQCELVLRDTSKVTFVRKEKKQRKELPTFKRQFTVRTVEIVNIAFPGIFQRARHAGETA